MKRLLVTSTSRRLPLHAAPSRSTKRPDGFSPHDTLNACHQELPHLPSTVHSYINASNFYKHIGLAVQMIAFSLDHPLFWLYSSKIFTFSRSLPISALFFKICRKHVRDFTPPWALCMQTCKQLQQSRTPPPHARKGFDVGSLTQNYILNSDLHLVQFSTLA